MWKVGDVEPVRVMGAEGYPYGFNVSTEDGKPVVSFAYASRALAEAAAKAAVEVHVGQFQPDDLGGPAAGGVRR